ATSLRLQDQKLVSWLHKNGAIAAQIGTVTPCKLGYSPLDLGLGIMKLALQPYDFGAAEPYF
ncbi:hypothetical protein PanWU01x14_101840, partial [Parasponia andersonii]